MSLYLAINFYIKLLKACCRRNKQAKSDIFSIKNKFIYENACPGVLKDFKSFVKNAGLTINGHRFYSPDLALSDFWLFDRIK